MESIPRPCTRYGATVINNGVRFDELSKVQSTTVHTQSHNGGGGSVNISVDIIEGSTQNHNYTSTTSVTVNNPTGIVAGDILKLNLGNNNGATGITPTFESAYELASALTQTDATNTSIYWFEALSPTRLIEVNRRENI